MYPSEKVISSSGFSCSQGNAIPLAPPLSADVGPIGYRMGTVRKQTTELPCAVIGYRTGADGLRDLLVAAMVDGAPRYVGSVELGIRGGRDLLERLNAIGIPRPPVQCSLKARWVAPELCCTVRFCGWRRGGLWGDAVLLRWEKV